MEQERRIGKTAIITGATSGIGEATARKFVAAGFRVVIAFFAAEDLIHRSLDFSDRRFTRPHDESKKV